MATQERTPRSLDGGLERTNLGEAGNERALKRYECCTLKTSLNLGEATFKSRPVIASERCGADIGCGFRCS